MTATKDKADTPTTEMFLCKLNNELVQVIRTLYGLIDKVESRNDLADATFPERLRKAVAESREALVELRTEINWRNEP